MLILELTRLYATTTGWAARQDAAYIPASAVVDLRPHPAGTQVVTAGGTVDVAETREEILALMGAEVVRSRARDRAAVAA